MVKQNFMKSIQPYHSRNRISDFCNCSNTSFFYFYLDYDTIGTAATPALLCQPRVIMKMIVESMMECRFSGETEVLVENLPQRHFCPSQNPTCQVFYRTC
jgi:hypothetical protein